MEKGSARIVAVNLLHILNLIHSPVPILFNGIVKTVIGEQKYIKISVMVLMLTEQQKKTLMTE